MDLIEAMQNEDARTENGALTHSTSSDRVVDLFFQLNAMRDRSEQDLISLFIPAVEQSPLDAMKVLFYSRDIRKGQGERRAFRVILKFLAETRPEMVRPNLELIPEFGRWDDLFELVDTPLESDAFSLIRRALIEDRSPLAAKWMPREKSSKKHLAKKLMKFLDLTPKKYRKMLSGLTKVVEQDMCSNEWDDINYQHVPSYAMKNYRKAFARHSPARWEEYLGALKSGESKVNAGTLYPHDLVRPFLNSFGHYYYEVEPIKQVEQSVILNEQWKALPNYMTGSSERIIPVCDVSGSMSGTPMEVSVALGLYISERNEGIFKDAFITFSNSPSMSVIKGKTLSERVLQLSRADWGMNTNLEAVFDLVLNKAIKFEVSPDKMPTMILILSDMEFDHCVYDGKDMTLMENIRRRYEESGYSIPKVVFWNLRAARKNFPVKYNETGVALVSGFSPSILTALLGGNDFSPESIMRQVIDSNRYSVVKI